MGKRIIIKTALICFGIFLIICTIVLSYILKKYPLDMEKHVSAVVAAIDIEEGTIIEDRHIRKKLIQQSAANDLMLSETSLAVGKKTSRKISGNDYIRNGDLVKKDSWYEKDDRIIILPVSIEERLANLIRRGSYVDIRLKKELDHKIELILSKVKVEDVLDESGNALDSISGVNSRTAYMKLILNEAERQKIYHASDSGKLIYELYCNEN